MKKSLLIFTVAFLFSSTVYAQKWVKLPGEAKAIAAAGETLAIIGMDDGIYLYDGSAWKEYPGGGAGKDIAVAGNVPFVIGMDDQVYKGTGTGWEVVSPGTKAKKISSEGYENDIKIIGMDDKIYYLDEGKFAETDEGKGVAPLEIATTDGRIRVIGTDNKIYDVFEGYTEFPGNGRAKKITSGVFNIIIIGVDDAIYRFGDDKWEKLPPAKAFDVAVASFGSASDSVVVYHIGENNTIYKLVK